MGIRRTVDFALMALVLGCGTTDKMGSGDGSVGRPPTVKITQPQNGEVVDPDAPVTLAAKVGDDRTAPEDLSVSLQSDLDGELVHTDSPNDAGDFKTEILLSSGTHVVTVEVTDEDGNSTKDEIALTANGRPYAPVIAINPAEPELADDLILEIVAESVDPDGDAVTYEIGWTVLPSDMESPSVYTPTEPGTIPADATERGAIWEVTVTPSDALGEGQSATTSVMVANGIPSISSVQIIPAEAYTSDELTAVVEGFTDPDGDPEDLWFEWFRNGDLVDGVEDENFPSSEHSRDDEVTVTVTPIDPYSEGDPITAEPVTILNTPPSIGSADIDPASPSTADDLNVMTFGWNDADGDSEGYQYRWFADGIEDASEIIESYPSSKTERGGVYQVEVTPYDGIDLGTPILSSEVTVGNTSPLITGVILSPTSPTTVDNILATPTGWLDEDGDLPTFTYQWSVNSSIVATTEDTLASYNFERGDVVEVSVTPLDEFGAGDPVTGGPVTIGNSAPSIGSVAISPNPAFTGDTLTCSWTGWYDADGDDDESTFEWFVGGVSAGTSESLSSVFSGGDAVTCVVTPNDGSDTGSTVSATVIIDNTAPSVADVSISPDPAYATDTLTCSWSGFHDSDGDPDESSARWSISGTPVGTGTTLSSGFSGGDTVTCHVLPSDGTSTGTEVSTSIVIRNTVPRIVSVTISSSETPPTTTATLTCNWSGYSDVDGDDDYSRVTWNFPDGTVIGTDTTLAGAFTGGDTITCTVTPFDGIDIGTPVTSDAIVIDNTPPVLELAALTPVPAFTDDTMVCSPGTVTDADGTSSFSYNYRWQVGGVILLSETGSSLAPSVFTRGQTVMCVITPDDGTDTGDPVSSNIVTIQNSRPVVESVDLSPTTVATNDVLTVAYTTSDADEEAVFVYIDWKVDGVIVLSGATATVLNGTTYFDKGQAITVDVTPNDGTETGETVTAGPIVVVNTPPAAPDVEISPSAPEPEDDLFCEVITDSLDVDLDAISYVYSWFVDGSETGHTSADLDASFTAHGERWECEVTPYDGEEDGESGVDSVVVNDATNPDPPVFDEESVFTNDTSYEVSGTCEADCTVEITCDDDLGSSLDSTTCTAAGDFDIELDFVRGDVATCTATCTDLAGNESGASDELSVESCAPEDIYEDDSGSGDSPGDVIDAFDPISDDATETITIEGNIVDGDESDWYVIEATDDVAEDLAAGVDYFNFHVQMTDGTSDYRMEVYAGGSGAGDEECPTEDGYTEYNWFPQDVGDGSHSTPSDTRSCATPGSSTRNVCEDNSENFYIHIYRLGTSTPSCQGYELTIDNGIW